MIRCYGTVCLDYGVSYVRFHDCRVLSLVSCGDDGVGVCNTIVQGAVQR